MDIAQATNACEPVMLAGKEYPVRQLRLSEWGTLQAWLKSRSPSPVTLAIQSLSEARIFGIVVHGDVRDEVMNHAYEAAKSWPPPVGSKKWLAVLDSTEHGTARFTQLVLEAGGTSLSIDEAKALYDSCTQEESDALFQMAYFGDPRRKKAAPQATAVTPTPSSTTNPWQDLPTIGAASSTG